MQDHGAVAFISGGALLLDDSTISSTDNTAVRILHGRLGVACVAHQALALRRAADPRRQGSAAVEDVVALVMGAGKEC